MATKVLVSRESLRKTLATVKQAIANNSPTIMLRGVLIHAGEDGMKLTGSNSVISISGTVEDEEYKTSEEIDMLLNADLLEKILSKAGGDTVEINIKDNIASIKCGGSKFKLNMLNVKDYPEIDFDGGSASVTINNSDFINMIDKTAFAVAKDNIRPILNGVNFILDGDQIIANATDSFRLSQIGTTVNSDVEGNITIPVDSLKVIRKIIAGLASGATLMINLDKNAVVFNTCNGYCVKSVLLAGKYPDVKSLIPSTGFVTEVTCDRLEFMGIIERGSIFKNPQFLIPVFKATITKDGQMSLRVRSQELGEFEETIPVTVTGDDLVIQFDGTYAMDMLRALKSDDIAIKFLGNLKPFIAENIGDDEKIVELMLPVRQYD